jgi:hypothetical protein
VDFYALNNQALIFAHLLASSGYFYSPRLYQDGDMTPNA